MKAYNGHRSWNAWNVSLWLYNDEDYYNDWYWAVGELTLDQTVARLVRDYKDCKTPDGAKFNALCIREAIKDSFKNEVTK